jgi:hypothetical protein
MIIEFIFFFLLFFFISFLILFYLLFPRVPKQYVECKLDPSQMETGKGFWKTQTIAICGLVRDGMGRLPKIRRQIENITSNVKDYHILIVENDSIDGTRDYLLDWAKADKRVKVLGCDGVNLSECKLKMTKTKNHHADMYRIEKMALLRNIYVDELKKEEYSSVERVLVWDMDLDGELDTDGFLQTGYELSKSPSIQAVCVNGILENFARIKSYAYYDTYAYRKEGDKYGKKVYYDLKYRRPKGCTSSLQKVRSCFGGLVIYRKDSLLPLRYGTEIDMYNEPICEHDYLNRELSSVYLNPKWLYLLAEH